MTKKRWFPVPMLGIALLLSGCAIGNKYDYADVQARLRYGGSGTVNVAVQDRRPDVIKDPAEAVNVGTQRARFGIPFGVSTASGRPLAEDLTDSLKRTLDGAGFQTSIVLVQPVESAEVAKSRLIAGAPKRAVLLRMDRWESDTMRNPTVRYNLTMTVYDARGTLLGGAQLQGEDALSGSFFMAIDDAKKNIPLFFEKKLEALMNMPEIRKALAG